MLRGSMMLEIKPEENVLDDPRASGCISGSEEWTVNFLSRRIKIDDLSTSLLVPHIAFSIDSRLK